MTSRSKPLVESRRNDGRLEIAIHAVPGWEGFDSLIQYLEENYEADLLRMVDGPGARRAWLVAGAVGFELEYDDAVGNALIAPDLRAEELLRTVADGLRIRFEGIEQRGKARDRQTAKKP